MNKQIPALEIDQVKENLKSDLGKTDPKATPVTPAQRKRMIVIETDGNSINLLKAEVSGNLELTAILEAILKRIAIK